MQPAIEQGAACITERQPVGTVGGFRSIRVTIPRAFSYCPQREIIARAYENGHPTVIPVSLLRALEENLH
jgi:hypothetical protein